MPGYIVVLALDLFLSALGRRRVLVLFVVRRSGAQQKMIAHRFASLEFAWSKESVCVTVNGKVRN